MSVVAEVALPVFAFYLLVACNYVKEVFGCGLQTVLEKDMYAKHVVAFILLFFLVVVVSPDYADKNILRNFLLSVGIYIWFIITTRTPVYIMLIVLILLLASYIASIARKRYNEEKDEHAAKKANLAQQVLAYGALVISLLGFVVYAVEKQREYGSDFQWTKFFSGNLNCRGYTPEYAKVLSM